VGEVSRRYTVIEQKCAVLWSKTLLRAQRCGVEFTTWRARWDWGSQINDLHGRRLAWDWEYALHKMVVYDIVQYGGIHLCTGNACKGIYSYGEFTLEFLPQLSW
jgi:hypothetical protein